VAITLVNTNHANTGSTATNTLTITGLSPTTGNVLVVIATSETNSSFNSLGSGVTIVDNTIFQDAYWASSLAVGYLVVPGSPPSSITITSSSSATALIGAVLEFSGVNTASVIDKHTAPVWDTTTPPSASTVTVAAMTPTQANDCYLMYAQGAGNAGGSEAAAITAGITFTTGSDSDPSAPVGGAYHLFWASGDYTGSAAQTGTYTKNSSSNAAGAGGLLLNPANTSLGDKLSQEVAEVLYIAGASSGGDRLSQEVAEVLFVQGASVSGDRISQVVAEVLYVTGPGGWTCQDYTAGECTNCPP